MDEGRKWKWNRWRRRVENQGGRGEKKENWASSTCEHVEGKEKKEGYKSSESVCDSVMKRTEEQREREGKGKLRIKVERGNGEGRKRVFGGNVEERSDYWVSQWLSETKSDPTIKLCQIDGTLHKNETLLCLRIKLWCTCSCQHGRSEQGFWLEL